MAYYKNPNVIVKQCEEGIKKEQANLKQYQSMIRKYKKDGAEENAKEIEKYQRFICSIEKEIVRLENIKQVALKDLEEEQGK